VTPEKLAELQAISAAVHARAEAHDRIVNSSHEVSMYWQTQAYGEAKGRLDGLGDGCWFDLKTTARIDSIGRQYANLAYDMQAGWYTEGLTVAGLCDKSPDVIVVESVPPYDVAVYQVPERAIRQGREVACRLAERYRECERNGEWPGVAPVYCQLPLPTWYGEQGPDIADDGEDE